MSNIEFEKIQETDQWLTLGAGQKILKVHEEAKFRFVWTIERFSLRRQQEKNGTSFCSSEFTIQGPDDMETKWKIEMFPKGLDQTSCNFLAVFLSSETEADVEAQFDCSILDKDMIRVNIKRDDGFKNYDYNEAFGYEKFIKYGTLKSLSSTLLSNDSLTIVCDITILGKMKPASASNDQRKQQNLIQDLETAFTNIELSDVQLQCGGQVFDCHQFMLSARSPVFRAMFQSNMMEKETGKVDVKDLHPDVLAEMLSFIYTGKTPNLDELAEGLLAAADQYQLEQLKSICEKSLSTRLNVENCLSYLILGDMYQAGNLKMLSLKFITSNRKDVFKSKDWRVCLQDHPALMADVIEALD